MNFIKSLLTTNTASIMSTFLGAIDKLDAHAEKTDKRASKNLVTSQQYHQRYTEEVNEGNRARNASTKLKAVFK